MLVALTFNSIQFFSILKAFLQRAKETAKNHLVAKLRYQAQPLDVNVLYIFLKCDKVTSPIQQKLYLIQLFYSNITI